MALSIQVWAKYSEGKTKMQRKSEDAVESNHVLKFQYDVECKVCTGVVQASQRDKSYKVEAMLGDGSDVLLSKCECPLGQFECHHVAALLLYGYKNVSKTDVPMQWLKTPKSSVPKVTKTISEMFPQTKADYRALKRPVTVADKDAMYADLSKIGRFLAIHWILSPEPLTRELPVPWVEDLFASSEYLQSSNPTLWLRQALQVNPQQIQNIVRATHGQRDNPLWAAVRKNRLTASNFGDIVRAIRLRNFPNSLRKKLTTSFSLESIKAIQWGINHEADAVADYSKFGFSVNPTGIWLHESGVLGASPDGMVQKTVEGSVIKHLYYQTQEAKTLQPQILEVKCPYAASESTVMALVGKAGFYLKHQEGNIVLKETHKYYHQVQGQLFLTGTSCCDFMAWSPRDNVIIRIAKNPSWGQNLSAMIDFFFTTFAPAVLEM